LAGFRAVVFFAAVLRTGAFFTVRRLAGLRAVVFFAAGFRAVVLRAVVFFAAAFFTVRRLAGLRAVVFFAAAFRAGAFLAGARLFAGLRAVVFLAAVFRTTRRFAGLRAGAFLAVVFRAVRRFAGGTVTTFLEGCSGRRYGCDSPYLFTADLNAAPAENFTPFDAAICTGSPVRGLRPVRAARDERENEPKPGSVTLSSAATAP